MKRPLRIAFLTPQFITEGLGTGGLGSYLYRISKALQDLGHEVEVLLPFYHTGNKRPGPFDHDGIRVERVEPFDNIPLKIVNRLRLPRSFKMEQTYYLLRAALGLALALSRREDEKPFDAVQSSDVGFPGLFVSKSPRRPLMVRCSWARDLWLKADGSPDVLDVRCVSRLERMLVRRADIRYAPSNLVADHYSRHHGLYMKTLRPPFLLDAVPSNGLPWELPKRFLLHFGTLGSIKGTDVLAAALPLVWRKEPDFAMVWAGQWRVWGSRGHEARPDLFDTCRRSWGARASQVIWLGEIRKQELYAVLKKAEAAVLPSCCDNLPNTAIESLALGIPVIGTSGSSIDELVEPGVSGEIVPAGDPAALAETMLKVWRREVGWTGPSFRRPAILGAMEPSVAASNLIRLAGFDECREFTTSAARMG
jgi:glycosyltransferase involved in cell wall biosynthesis